MAKRVILLVICFVLVIVEAPGAWAQTPDGSNQQNRPSIGGPRRQLATIIFTGLGGAVLGLSTLSFYGRPQDHLQNIALGFGVGIITGTVIMTYQAATNPREFYGPGSTRRGAELWPESWDSVAFASTQAATAEASLPQVGWRFEF